MSKKIEFFSSDEQSGNGNQTRRVSPSAAPQGQAMPEGGGNVTRRVTPTAAPQTAAPMPSAEPMMTPQPMDETTDAPRDAGPAARPTHTRVLGRVSDAPAEMEILPTVGWLVIMEGPGRGASHALEPGMSQIGRANTNRVCLNYGDNSVSRENHAFVAYDEESRKFYIGHGGKANLVRLNEKVVLSEMEMEHGDFIRIGETALRFIAFCGPHFDWADLESTEEQEAGGAAAATTALEPEAEEEPFEAVETFEAMEEEAFIEEPPLEEAYATEEPSETFEDMDETPEADAEMDEAAPDTEERVEDDRPRSEDPFGDMSQSPTSGDR